MTLSERAVVSILSAIHSSVFTSNVGKLTKFLSSLSATSGGVVEGGFCREWVAGCVVWTFGSVYSGIREVLAVVLGCVDGLGPFGEKQSWAESVERVWPCMVGEAHGVAVVRG